jgi:hypothetical protein
MPDWLWNVMPAIGFSVGGMFGYWLGVRETLRHIVEQEEKQAEAAEDRVVHGWGEKFHRIGKDGPIPNSEFLVPFVAEIKDGKRVLRHLNSSYPIATFTAQSTKVAKAAIWAEGGPEPDFFRNGK